MRCRKIGDGNFHRVWYSSFGFLLSVVALFMFSLGQGAEAGEVASGSCAVSPGAVAGNSTNSSIDIKDLLNLGNRHLETGRYERAIQNYSKVSEVLMETDNPNLVTAYFNRGLAYHLNGDYDKAIEDFDRVITMNPEDDKAFYYRGNAHALQRSADKALEDYSRAIRLNPDDARLYYYRGLAYQENPATLDLAVDDFKRAIALDPSDAKTHCFLGIVYYKQQQYRTAAKYFGMAIDIDPLYGEAYTGRGQAYLRAGHMDKALEDFRRACEKGERTGCTMIEFLAKMGKITPATGE